MPQLLVPWCIPEVAGRQDLRPIFQVEGLRPEQAEEPGMLSYEVCIWCQPAAPGFFSRNAQDSPA
eukprot:2819033-Lingulodinium_polyedra.AAC.1